MASLPQPELFLSVGYCSLKHEPGELSQCLEQDDSTMKIIVVIILWLWLLCPASSGWHHITSDTSLTVVFDCVYPSFLLYLSFLLFPHKCPYNATYGCIFLFILAMWQNTSAVSVGFVCLCLFCQFSQFWISLYQNLSVLDTSSVFRRQILSKTFKHFPDVALISQVSLPLKYLDPGL